jgi:hypothetical protein
LCCRVLGAHRQETIGAVRDLEWQQRLASSRGGGVALVQAAGGRCLSCCKQGTLWWLAADYISLGIDRRRCALVELDLGIAIS